MTPSPNWDPYTRALVSTGPSKKSLESVNGFDTTHEVSPVRRIFTWTVGFIALAAPTVVALGAYPLRVTCGEVTPNVAPPGLGTTVLLSITYESSTTWTSSVPPPRPKLSPVSMKLSPKALSFSVPLHVSETSHARDAAVTSGFRYSKRFDWFVLVFVWPRYVTMSRYFRPVFTVPNPLTASCMSGGKQMIPRWSTTSSSLLHDLVTPFDSKSTLMFAQAGPAPPQLGPKLLPTSEMRCPGPDPCETGNAEAVTSCDPAFTGSWSVLTSGTR